MLCELILAGARAADEAMVLWYSITRRMHSERAPVCHCARVVSKLLVKMRTTALAEEEGPGVIVTMVYDRTAI